MITKQKWFVFGTRKKFSNSTAFATQIGNAIINPSPKVKNLGVIFDQHCTMDSHITMICRQSYYQLRNIASIRRYLTPSAVKTLVQACIISRIDYANGILYGISSKATDRLQRVQNMAARVVTKTKRRSHVTPVLQELHWLPVKQRIKYKILTITYKALHGLAPGYISDLILVRQSTRSLRSSAELLLTPPRTRLHSWGDRTYQYAAATEWNALPKFLRDSKSFSVFKKHLKTHLFKIAFNV